MVVCSFSSRIKGNAFTVKVNLYEFVLLSWNRLTQYRYFKKEKQ